MSSQSIIGPKLSVVALALAQAFASQAMAQQADNTVVVTGIRASAESSLSIKRDTMGVVDSITAEDIGKLPDPNVSETLTRIPGVQGYRYGGEGASPVGAGSGVTIRGLSGQTASQVNGRAYFTAGSREFNVEGAIPGMIAGIDVYKNPSAEQIEGGIGGLVNIRTRNPSDFKGLTASLNVNARYNDLAKETDPEVFGLVANRINLSGGQRIGLMAAAVYQKSVGRSDNNPANGGANLKRAVRADSAEYAALAAGNAANAANLPQSRYIGRSDTWYLANVPTRGVGAGVGPNTPDLTGLTPDQAGNVMVAPALTSNVFQETIMRERRGLNLAADYRVDNTLRFYSEANHTYYGYHQHYRGLNSVDGANVRGLQTTPFNFTEGLANRNLNGGSDDVLVGQRLLGGSFLDSTVNTVGGDEFRPYKTSIAAAGVDWSPTPSLSLKLDVSYIRSSQTQDNRSANLDSAPGLTWTTHRLADGAPHQLNFDGPALDNPANFVFRDYNNGTRQSWDDSGNAVAFNGAYMPDEGFIFNRIKFGTRFASQDSRYENYSYSGRPLTRDGLALNAARSNGIVASTGGLVELAPTNFMRGDAGYPGGFVAYAPGRLTGNQVRDAFPSAGILPDDALVENALSRRLIEERTKAVYLQGEFAALDERIKGNIGVRVVRTESDAVARVADTSGGTAVIRDVQSETSYTNALPSFNVSYDIMPDFLARFAYGRGMTRAGLEQLNPSITVDPVNGTGSVGNPDLRPLIANSVDLSFERYFSKTNYAALALFNKRINGFFNGIVECQSVATAPQYAGTVNNSCGAGQYQITKTVNSEKGYARGVELSGQYFFDGADGWMKNFGLAGSYTFVKTSNPINFGTAAAPRIVDTPQPMQSKNSFSVSAMYEDSKMSARLVYTWRSPSILFGVSANPIDGRYIEKFGILDGSFNYELSDNMTLSFNASNITDKTLNRYVGEPGGYATGLERQHYANGRTFSLGLRYKFGQM
ncbi:TonB-dependent receptor [Telluria beijingensis]|uniref:TonB-dependent receptor n=1 Tax=Telluria beijingensis TaxID=3068633 RepID=UPI0027955ADD|nr:TonB-dependent receptor [Massilia sp. REN29]